MANGEPQTVKSFRAVEIQGNNAWKIVDVETNLVSTSIPSESFEKKEGFWYAEMPRAKVGSVDGNMEGVGTVSNIFSLTVTIDGFDISQSPITVGDRIFSTSGLVGNITSISGGALSLTSVTGLNVGDFIYAMKTSFVDGDAVKGYYAKMIFEHEGTDYAEVFMVNNSVSVSGSTR